MSGQITQTITLVVVAGIGAQWFAARVRHPALPYLIVAGAVLGPGLGWIDVDVAFGPALMPMTHLAVGLLLFEAGMGLEARRLPPGPRRAVIGLCSIGLVVTWMLAALSAHLIFGLDEHVALLVGATLSVSGPTVIGPLLRFSRATDPSAAVLRWESVFIDPIGVTVAVLVFEAAERGGPNVVWRVIAIAAAGLGIGTACALLLVAVFRRHWVPDHLEIAVVLLSVVGAYGAADLLAPEAGLLAATILGVALANQRTVPVAELRHFSDTLSTLMIGVLFVALASRVAPEQVGDVIGPVGAFVAVMAFVIRPTAAWLSTIRSGMGLRHRAFVAGLGPRGIVAAASVSAFALRLEASGHPQPLLVPIVFGTVVGLALLYSITTGPLARALHTQASPDAGIVIVGESAWAVDVAKLFESAGVPVSLCGTDAAAAAEADVDRLLVGAAVGDALDYATKGRAAGLIATDSERAQLLTPHIVRSLGRARTFAVAHDVDDPNPQSARQSSGLRRAGSSAICQTSIDEAYRQGHRFELLHGKAGLVAEHAVLASIDGAGMVHFVPSPPADDASVLALWMPESVGGTTSGFGLGLPRRP